MRNKLLNLLIWETKISLRLILIIALIFGWALLGKKQKSQVARLNKIKEEKHMVEKIPGLEKKLAKANPNQETTQEMIEKDPTLKGVFVQNGSYYAIIDDTFYKEGEDLGKYKISKIALYYVVLEDKDANNTKVIYYSP